MKDKRRHRLIYFYEPAKSNKTVISWRNICRLLFFFLFCRFNNKMLSTMILKLKNATFTYLICIKKLKYFRAYRILLFTLKQKTKRSKQQSWKFNVYKTNLNLLPLPKMHKSIKLLLNHYQPWHDFKSRLKITEQLQHDIVFFFF